MKRTQRKDAWRNIWKQKVSFLSIVVIALLGVTMFLGMNYGAAAIDRNGTDFYNGVNFRDVEIVSTRLLSPEDMEILRSLEGVIDVEGLLMSQAKVTSGDVRMDVTVISVTERINRPVVREGRLPEGQFECAVETSVAQQMGWKTGDWIELRSADGTSPQFVTGAGFQVVGIADHPDHICGSMPETPYVLLDSASFDLDIFNGCFMKAEILVDAPRELGRFEGPYREATARVQERIDAIREERAAKRQTEVDEQIHEAAKNSLTFNWDRVEEVKEDIRSAIRDKLTETLGVDSIPGIAWASKKVADLTDEKTTAMKFWLTEKVSADLSLSMRDNVTALVSSLPLSDEILGAAFRVLEGQGEFSSEAAIALVVDEIMPALEPYQDGYEALVSACTAWDDSYEKFLDGTLWEELGLPGVTRWIVTDVSGNMSFVQLGSSRDSLSSLEMTFSLLFMAVGALVIYATVSKMIDEQRSLVGATKALGFYQREIFAKYLTFGVSSTLLGTLAGLLIARFLVEPFILNGYQIYYRADITRPALTVWPTVIVFGAGLLLSVAAVWFACRRLLKTPAVVLLQAAMPKGRKKTAQKASRLPLYSRLILRNIRSDLRRVIVTVVSVAGCCALVVVGFTIRHGVSGSVAHQFTDIVQYDGMFRFDPNLNEEAGVELAERLRQAGAETCPIYDTYATVRLRNLDVEELIVGDLDAVGRMFRLYDAKTGAAIVPSDEGVYIPKRISEFYGVEPGDVIEITVNATETVQAPVAGVFNNYMNRITFMSEGCFAALFGREHVENALLVQLNGADAAVLNEAFGEVPGYSGYTASDTYRKLFASATSVINAVVALFIFMAAVMAGVVLLNLTNIYILQKKRELTVMRINGFTTKEVIAYVTRETVFTTALGILMGIGLGAGLGYAIVRALEQPFIQFDRSVSLTAWLIAVGMTVFFTVIVNVIALRKVKRLKLTDMA